MDNELRELYQQVILDHNKSPRNFKRLETANHYAEGYNPLCGDRIDVYIKLNDDKIEDVSFMGSGCAISKASASLMSTMVKGKTIEETDKIFEKFHHLITGKIGEEVDAAEAGKLAVFAGVREFPSRVKCASLAWHTLISALKEENKTVKTE
jgi:nitrogen fixation NifU-like protein